MTPRWLINFYILFIMDSINCIACSSPTDCMKRSAPNCCDDYYEEDTFCKRCIGAFGKNCSGGVCPSGFYGHGCREKCLCGTMLCDRIHGCPTGPVPVKINKWKVGTSSLETIKDDHQRYCEWSLCFVNHYWIFIILGVLMINSIPVIIAVNGFLTFRQRNSLQNQEISEEKPRRNIWQNIFSNSFPRCLRRRSSDNESEEDTEQDLSELERQRRGVGRLNVYVDALLKRVRQAPSDDNNEEEISKDDYFVMRLSTAPPSENVHPSTVQVMEENNDESDDDENYVEMQLHSNSD